MSAKPFRIISADHTGITVANLERSLAFWRDVLGFELSHTAHQTGEMPKEITGVAGAEIKLAVLRAPGCHKIELLEYLAEFFIRNGMSIKKLHREILLSAVYQLSNDFSQAAFDKDSTNRLYWRSNRRRLDAEQIRDSLLAVSGALDRKIGGPSEPLTPQYTRRTVYGKASRYKLDDYLQLFDFPTPNLTAEQRYTTDVPLQRLFFMNSDFVQQQAELLARRVESEPDMEARIQKAYRIVFGRTATAEEVQLGLDYVKNEPMRQYEERRKAEEEKTKEPGKPGKNESMTKDAMDAPKPDMPAMDPDGMMAGVVPGTGKPDDKKPLLPVTAWGRYIKVLLSSNEFIFLN